MEAGGLQRHATGLGAEGLRFRVWGLGFRFWGLGLKVWGFRFRAKATLGKNAHVMLRNPL